MNQISIVILTRNEEKNIVDCLESLSAFKDIVIIDDGSTDRTEEIIKNYDNVRIFKREMNGDFSAQRNFGLSKAKNEWVLFIDADERVSRDLYREIMAIDLEKTNGALIKRVDNMWGRTLKFGETANISFVRLGNKKKGKWTGTVHESWGIKGDLSILSNPILHFPHQTVAEFIREVDYYSTLRARELFNVKKTVNFFDVLFYPTGKFIHNYLIRLGFLDGVQGFIVAAVMSFHSFLVRVKLRLLIKNEG